MFYKVRGISKKSGLGTVYVVFRDMQGSETLKSTGVQVDPAHFNTKSGKISPKDTLFPEKNAKIAATVADFETVIRNMKTAGLPLLAQEVGERVVELQIVNDTKTLWHEATQDWRLLSIQKLENDIQALREKLAEMEIELERRKQAEGLAAVDKPVYFQDMIKEFIAQKAADPNIRPGTLKNYGVTATMVAEYNRHLEMKDMNLKFFQDFQQHLIRKGLRNSTINESFIRLKAVYKHLAEELGIDTNWLRKFNVVKAEKDENVIYLTPTELQAIEDLNITTKGQHRTRELFLFSCETGLRFSDLLVTRADVQETEYRNDAGETVQGKVLVVKTEKRRKTVRVPLTPKAISILERNNYSFSRPNESQYNQALRAIGAKIPMLHAEITLTHTSGSKIVKKTCPKWKALKSHVGRKTFTNNAIDRGVSLMTVAEWLGHADTKTLEAHYAHKADNAKREAYKLFE
ncbi:site-specific integrase [Hymenobacter coalescens]